MEKVRVSPVPKEADIIRVEIMMPATIRADWALRRGMLRNAIFSITRLRTAIKPITAKEGRKTASSASMMWSILTPKRSSIYSPD